MPEVIGLLLLEAFGFAELATTILIGSTTVASAVGSAVLIGGSLAGAALLSRPSQTEFAVPKPSDGTKTLRQAIPPRLMGYGRCRIAGAFVLYEAGDNGYSYDVLALHEGRISAFQLYYLNDDLVGINIGTGGFVNSVIGSDDGRYIGSVVIQTRLGLSTETAYSDAVTGIADSGIWGNGHRGDGVASAFLRCAPVSQENHFTIYPNGLPKLSVVADLAPVYDPRDVTQVRSEPHTWKISSNPVLQLLNYLTDSRGLGIDWADIVEPNIGELMAQADACDEEIVTIGGTENRYRSAGWFFLINDPADVIASILSTCDGWMTEAGDGTLSIVVGKYVPPTITLTDDHIIGFDIAHGVADEEAVNEIKFAFTAPDNDYREAPGTPWRDEAAISEAGIIRSQSITLTWVQSHSQARRLAKRAMLRHQARLRGTLTTTLYGLLALGERWVAVQSEMVDDLSNAVIEITRARIDIPNARVNFEWVLVNPNEIDAWEPSTEEGYSPTFPGKITLLPLYVPSGMVATGVGGQKIQVVFGDPARPDLIYAVEYRIGAGAWSRQTFEEYTPSGGSITLTTTSVAVATYDVRVASIAAQGSISAWSTIDTATVT
jgi:Putative phage tail protein